MQKKKKKNYVLLINTMKKENFIKEYIYIFFKVKYYNNHMQRGFYQVVS